MNAMSSGTGKQLIPSEFPKGLIDRYKSFQHEKVNPLVLIVNSEEKNYDSVTLPVTPDQSFPLVCQARAVGNVIMLFTD